MLAHVVFGTCDKRCWYPFIDQQYFYQCQYLHMLLIEGINVLSRNYENVINPLQEFP